MPRKYFTPANRTVIFTGFREDLEVSAIHEFCHQSLSVEPSLSAGLADQGISVTSGKVYINFKDCVAARRAITVLSKLSVDEICSPGSHIEIWLKELGRSSSVSSPISSKKGGKSSEIPEGATKKDFRSTVQDKAGEEHGEEEEEGTSAGEFEVHLNESLVREIGGSKSFQEFAEDFASWNPDEETSREFKPQDIEELMKKIEQDDSTVQVLGFNEFPYTAGNKLKGNDREVEREYWLQLRNVDRRLAGDDNLAILHVHYKGKWHPVPHHRDRSVITQINIRHTTRTRAKAFHMKCADLNKWREKHGSSVLKQIPKTGWKWREDIVRCKPVHKVLVGAERCTKKVRSLDVGGAVACSAGLRRALIIAVKKYDGDTIPDLANAIHDGSKLESALQLLGWDVAFETNLPLEAAEAAISEFVERVADNADACLFAFVGHGIEVRGKQYFVPRDARLGEREYASHDDLEQAVARRCVAFDFVRQRFRERRDASEPTIFVLDCCRNDFWRVREAQSRSVQLQRQQSAGSVVCDVENSIVIFSTTSGSTAEDGPAGQGGPFMASFVEEAMQQGRDLDEALGHMRKRVRDGSTNCQLAPSTSLLYGKFCFHPGPHPFAAAPAVRDAAPPPLPAAAAAADIAVLQRIANEDAREFWREYFHTDEEVAWSSFRPALLAEFPDLDLGPAALAHIKRQMDHDDDGRIHAREFNIFTKRAGLAAQVAAVARDFAADPPGGEPPSAAPAPAGKQPVAAEAPDAAALAPCVAADAPATPPTTSAPSEDAAPDAVAQDDPLRPVVELGRASITYVGTGSVLGGQKLRQGTLEINGCWVTVVRERGDAKDPLHVGECSVVRSDKIAPGRSIEIIPPRGKNVVVALATPAERERWVDALAACRRLVDEAREANGMQGTDSRYAEIVGELAPMGRLQLVCTGGEREFGPPDVAHALGRRPLDAVRPHFEVLVRALPSRACASVGVAQGAAPRRSDRHAGQLTGEVGLHSYGELLCGPGDARALIPALRVGDVLGCGVLFDPAGKEQCVYFTVNGQVLATAPRAANGAPPHPLIAASGKGLRLEVTLGLPAPASAATFQKRCRVEGPRRAAAAEFGSLAEAVGAAQEGETVSLEAGMYCLTDTLVLQRGVAIRALVPGAVEIYKRGGGVAVACQAEGVVLAGVRVRCAGGDSRARYSDPGSATAVAVRSGACRLEGCAITCPSGSGAVVAGGRLECAAGSCIGPCGRHGVVCFKGAAAALDGAVVERCAVWCVAVNGGSRVEIAGCTLLASGPFSTGLGPHGGVHMAVCDSSEAAATSLTISGSKLTGTASATGVNIDGPGLAASVVGCRLEGFETAAAAGGHGAKLSLRDCAVAQCTRGFLAREDSVVVRVDCRLDEVKTPEATWAGGRVVDV